MIRCGSDERRSAVKSHTSINGIDYLEVISPSASSYHYGPLLMVRCFKDISSIKTQGSGEIHNQNVISKDNIAIRGGVIVRNVRAEWVATGRELDDLYAHGKISQEELDSLQYVKRHDYDTLIIRLNTQGDFSTYELGIVASADLPDVPANNFDPVLFKVPFSFKHDHTSDFDCSCKQSTQQDFFEPAMDYLAKDYSSFRRLLLDRLSLIIPNWKERNSADMGIMLVELLAYMGDHLSYYQDAVGTEAYLGTARKRVSARRHARLLDYFIDDGCNARVWVCFQVNSTIPLEQKSILLTDPHKAKNYADNNSIEIYGKDLEDEINKGAEVFETMYDTTLYKSKNRIRFYTWGETTCWLPKGCTSATIRDEFEDIDAFIWEEVPEGNDISGEKVEEVINYLRDSFGFGWLDNVLTVSKSSDKIIISSKDKSLMILMNADNKSATLIVNDDNKIYDFKVKIKDDKSGKDQHRLLLSSCLKVGDVLIFSESDSSTIKAIGSDPFCPHAVRLTSVITGTDNLLGEDILNIEWRVEDALPFAVCLVKDGIEMSQAFGNVVLADHGYTIDSENLEVAISAGRYYYPALERSPLTYAGPLPFKANGNNNSNVFVPVEAAATAFDYRADQVKPAITLKREGHGKDYEIWEPVRDLLSSDEFAKEFKVETESDAATHLRFSNSNRRNWVDDIESGYFKRFNASYRIGNGETGNVGPNSIKRIFSSVMGKYSSSIQAIFNPLSAKGGREPESLRSVRQHAPQSFRRQERAVTESDYSEVLKRHTQVQQAVAMKRWTGSWYTMFIAIDRKGGLEVDHEFKTKIINFLEKYRMAGYDIDVNGPTYVPLKIVMEVCIKEGYFANEVKEVLYETFSNGILENGRSGFFHPDNFTFGQALYLSEIYEVSMSVEGVASVYVKTFERWRSVKENELKEGVIRTELVEIIRLDNDLNHPENGMIEIQVV